jgi:glutamate 5-kinase
MITRLVGEVVELRERGVDVVLVSSGSIVEGMQRLGWQERPRELYKLQAAAAVGQMGLVETYQRAFSEYGVQAAQVLLTDADLTDRSRYLNARSALRTLLQLGTVPVVNENDSVVTQEIRFGDNDTLAALVANLIEAEYLLILTDQEGLYDRDPNSAERAQLIEEGVAGDPLLEQYGKAARSGASTIILSGRHAGRLIEVLDGRVKGTLLKAESGRLTARKQWLAGRLRASGRLLLDSGAVKVLTQSGRSLLPVGVRAIEGVFERGELVDCVDETTGAVIARGLVNYSSVEASRIIGQPSAKIEQILGYVDEPELIHRDNIVIQ